MLEFLYQKGQGGPITHLKHYKPGTVGVIEEASDRDIKQAAKVMKLAEADLVDIYDAQEIPRLEIDNGVVLLFVRAPLPLDNTEALETQLYMMVLNRTKLFVITNVKASHFMTMLAQHRHELKHPAKLLIEFLLYLSRAYAANINEISKRVEHYRTKARSMTNAHIEELIDLEVILNEYVTVLSPMQRICEALVSSKRIDWQESDTDLIEDLTISVAQSADISLVNLKKIHSLRDSFQIIFTNRLNQTVKVLTSVTIILTLPTMIASIFGMNVSLPLSSHPNAFLIVLGLAIFVSGTAGWYFKKNNWM